MKQDYNQLASRFDKVMMAKYIAPEESPPPKTETIALSPYKGVMEAVVKQVLNIANKPQPELTILSALIGMASSIGGNYKLPGGTRLNLYGMGISGTGTGKDKAMLAGESIALMAKTDLLGMPGSGAGLEDALKEEGTRILLNIDEVAHFIAALNDNKQTHMASVSGNLLKLFSASRTKYVTRRLANSSNNEQIIARNPCVSLLGFACPERLGVAFGNGENVDDGLIGRFLVVNGRPGVKPRRDTHELHFNHKINAIAESIITNLPVTILFSKEADQKLDELLQKFDSESQQSSNPFAKNLKVRSFEKCERVAGVLAVWDCPESPVITLEHVEWAYRFISYSDNAILEFTNNHMHGGQTQSNAEKIKKIIEKFRTGELVPTLQWQKDILKISGTFPRTSILKASKFSKVDFDLAIDHLIDLGEVQTGIIDKDGEKYKVIIK